jgi:DNA mismatch repair protein MutH
MHDSVSLKPPEDEAALLARAQAIAGLALGDLAELAGLETPENFRHAKGFAGQLIELCLGASAGSHPMPDFPHLGIELKTIPIDVDLKPLESTHICLASVDATDAAGHGTWRNSLVYRKLARVLWIPILGARGTPPGSRRICAPLFWSPTAHQESILRTDWEEIMELITLGRAASINARMGTALQLRPKALNQRTTTSTLDESGTRVQVNPRGFYLRSSFTQGILADGYALTASSGEWQ